jgi:hypothetical protein
MNLEKDIKDAKHVRASNMLNGKINIENTGVKVVNTINIKKYSSFFK